LEEVSLSFPLPFPGGSPPTPLPSLADDDDDDGRRGGGGGIEFPGGRYMGMSM
jgi:hypothetical protein